MTIDLSFLLRNIYLYICFQVFFAPSFSQNIIQVNSEQEQFEVVKHIEYYEDKKGLLNIRDISKSDFEQNFKKIIGDKINFSYSNSIFWFRFQIKRTHKDSIDYSNSANHWLLQIAYPLLDELAFYTIDKTGTWQSTQIGDIFPYKQREVRHRFFNFPLRLSDTLSHTYYLRAKTQSPVYLPMAVINYSKYHQLSLQDELYYGIFLGIFLLVIINNIFLFLGIREISYLIYVIYISTTFLLNITLSGHFFQYLYTDYGGWQNTFLLVVLLSSQILAAVYTVYFLQIKKFSAISYRIILVWIGLNLLFSPFIFILPYSSNSRIIQLFSLINLIIVLGAGIIAQKKGNRSARYYNVAYFLYLLWVLIPILKNFGITGKGLDFLVVHGVEFGMLSEAIFLSIALVDRTRKERKQALLEKEKAQLEALEIQKKANETLELKVAERTQQLEDALEELHIQNDEITQQKKHLSDLNQIKDKLFSIISHDLRSPLNSLQGFLFVLKAKAISKEDIEHISSKINDTVLYTLSVMDNLLHWAKSQMQGFEVNPSKINLKELTEENILFLKQFATDKHISIINQINGNAQVEADLEMTRLVIRNLIANAIKFTSNRGFVSIYTKEQGNMVELCVEDTGVGIQADILSKLFDSQTIQSSRGTANEKGTGLGLILCKEFVEKNGGEIKCESELGKGSIFSFTLYKT